MVEESRQTGMPNEQTELVSEISSSEITPDMIAAPVATVSASSLDHSGNVDNAAETVVSALLLSAIYSNQDGGEDTGVDSMVQDPRLEEAFALIRAVIADADKRAADELVARISGTNRLTQTVPSSINPSPDKRAPRGSAATLIDRALEEAGDKGLTVFGIQAKAATEFEKMVSISAIRNWLKENERKHPPRYRQVGGVWFLAGRGPIIKAVGQN